MYLERICKEHGHFQYICACSYHIDSNYVRAGKQQTNMLYFLNNPFKCLYDLQIDLFDILTLRRIFFKVSFFKYWNRITFRSLVKGNQ